MMTGGGAFVIRFPRIAVVFFVESAFLVPFYGEFIYPTFVMLVMYCSTLGRVTLCKLAAFDILNYPGDYVFEFISF